jgi:hypothetical protein
MKLTWFGGTTIRIHIGGEILVADPELAPPGVDRGELVSGSNRSFLLAEDDAALPLIDSPAWRPRSLPRVIDDTATTPVTLFRLAGAAVLIDAAGEPPLVLATGGQLRLGRWAGDAAVVLLGSELTPLAATLLENSPPRLIALAAPEAQVDAAIVALRDRLEGTALVALEPGLALEI